MFSENDLLAARLTFSGTQQRALGPYRPSGRTLRADFTSFCRVQGRRALGRMGPNGQSYRIGPSEGITEGDPMLGRENDQRGWKIRAR
jgi:hypothetical protein